MRYTCLRGKAGITEVPFHLMPRWRSPISANASLHLQKGCSHSLCRRAPEQPRPSHSPCLLNTPLHEWGFTPCPSLGQPCQEPIRLLREPATNFHSKDDQSSSRLHADELRVPSFLDPPGCQKGHPGRLRPTLANPILANPFLAIVLGRPNLANPFLAKIRG